MFGHVTVACEPTGPRWLQVQRLCAERGLPLVCIQPLMSHIAPFVSSRITRRIRPMRPIAC